MNDLISLVPQVGFPMVVAFYLLIRVEGVLKGISETLVQINTRLGENK